MSKLQALIDYTKRGAFDELYTPKEAIEMLLPYIPSSFNTVWECTADGSSEKGNIAKVLGCRYNVVTSHIKNGQSFFEYEPDQYDAIITNPPYKYKDLFLQRAYELEKPFAFLLPLTALEGKFRNGLYKKHGVQVVVPDKRFNFLPNKKGAWFQTSWFTWGFELQSDLIFCEV